VKNCENKNSIINLLSSSIVVIGGNEAASNSCSKMTSYKSALVNVHIVKNNLQLFDGHFDVCNKKKPKKDLMLILMALFGIPNKCPIVATEMFCYNGTKIAKLSDTAVKFMPILFADGKDSLIRVNVTHDKGISCFEAEINVK
jgi:hypothetical protein